MREPLKTINCVFCLTHKAIFWTGYVLHKEGRIMAGWCGVDRSDAPRLNASGFSGHYLSKMGKEEIKLKVIE